jgi:hypothetical protein
MTLSLYLAKRFANEDTTWAILLKQKRPARKL